MSYIKPQQSKSEKCLRHSSANNEENFQFQLYKEKSQILKLLSLSNNRILKITPPTPKKKEFVNVSNPSFHANIRIQNNAEHIAAQQIEKLAMNKRKT